MNIDELKNLSLNELKKLYFKYLESLGLSKNTINTSLTDAFYLLRNDNPISFWELLLSDDFEEEAKHRLNNLLLRTSSGNVTTNINGYMYHLRKFKKFIFSDNFVPSDNSVQKQQEHIDKSIPKPCKSEIEYYLNQWNLLENYRLQEEALNRLFFEYAPNNTDISDILLKAATLNDFYSTNILSIYPVAKHILSLNIDTRLVAGDVTLVDDLKLVEIGGKQRCLYSFATKYCSHHNPDDFPIYDKYVDRILIHFKNEDRFSTFSNASLKNYKLFKKILIDFRNYYSLQEYSLKQLDQYLWQLGKAYYPKKYK